MMSDQDTVLHETEVKILLVGEKGVGKTTLARRYVTGSFDPNVPSTFDVGVLQRVITVEDQRVKVILFDTVGHESTHDFNHDYCTMVNAIVIVFDSTCRRSFFKLPEWFNLVQTSSKHGVRIFFIGTKFDEKHCNIVSSDEVRELSNEFRVPVFETSALTGDGVEPAFISILDSLKRQQCPRFLENGNSLARRRRTIRRWVNWFCWIRRINWFSKTNLIKCITLGCWGVSSDSHSDTSEELPLLSKRPSQDGNSKEKSGYSLLNTDEPPIPCNVSQQTMEAPRSSCAIPMPANSLERHSLASTPTTSASQPSTSDMESRPRVSPSECIFEFDDAISVPGQGNTAAIGSHWSASHLKSL